MLALDLKNHLGRKTKRKKIKKKYSKQSQYQSSPSRCTLSYLSDSSCSQNSRTKALRTKLHMKKQKENKMANSGRDSCIVNLLNSVATWEGK
ncbi:hypothetical protein H5410_017984 [Solanum commersonii]|uniref:Uncharacterized protein n=1 Tax=Solanum commersonii TaxID=4109 RepID=A0A9J6A115_SOLCO|nr:hypothetical protein H5410_017984 [Solanum commersonii]